MTGTGLAVRDDAGYDPVTQFVLGWLAGQSSVHTRRAYGGDVAGWLEWCAGAGVDPLGAIRPDAARWARRLDAQGLAASTVARKLAAASSWYDWLVEQEHVTVNPFAKVRRPKVDRKTSKTPALTREQAAALLRAADNARGSQHLRTSALIATLAFSAARVSEIVEADIEDLGISSGHRILWVTRKGGEEAALVLTAPATERIDAYLASRPDVEHLPAKPDETGARPRRVLFATSTGRRLWAPDVWHLVRRLGKAAGLPPELIAHMGPHGLRHTAITFALAEGVPLHEVQDMAGHEDPGTTQRYNHARHRLERSPAYVIAAYMAAAEEDT
jgi:integrase/recombinase XerD